MIDDEKEISDEQKNKDLILHLKTIRDNEDEDGQGSRISEYFDELKEEGKQESFDKFDSALLNKEFKIFLKEGKFKNNFLLNERLGDFIVKSYNQKQEDHSKLIKHKDLEDNLADKDGKIKLLGHGGKVFKIGLRANIGTVISQLYHEDQKKLKELRALGYLNNISATIKELKDIVDDASAEICKFPLELLLAELRDNLGHNVDTINKSDKVEDKVKIIADMYVSLRNIERKLRDNELEVWDPIKDDLRNWDKIPDPDNKNDNLIIRLLKGILQAKNKIADFFDDYVTGPEVDYKKLDAAIDSGDFSSLEKLEAAFKAKVAAVKPKNSP